MTAINFPPINYTFFNKRTSLFLEQTFLSRLFILSAIVFFIGFFLFPNAKSLNTWFYFILIPLTVLNTKALSLKEVKSPYLFCAALYLFYCFVSTMWSTPWNIQGSMDVLMHSLYLLFFLVFILILEKTPRALLWSGMHAFIIAASLSALLSILAWYSQHPFNSRLEGLFRSTHPIQSVWALSVPAIICIQRFIVSQSLKKILGYFVLALPLLLFIVLTQSRGPLLALAIAIGFFLVRYHNKRSLLILATLFLFAVFYYPLILRSFDTVNFRQHIWLTVWHEIVKSPIFGYGYLASRKVQTLGMTFDHAHNAYLQILFLGGIIGLILQSIMIGAALWRAWIYRHSEIMFTLMVMLVFALVCMLSDGSTLITNPREVWLCFWFPLLAMMTWPVAGVDQKC